MEPSSQKILIVDDVELNRAILGEVFTKSYTILEAEDGRQALEFLERDNDTIIMVLLDIVMPHMDGFELLSIMNQKNWINRIPVIMISSENSEEITMKGYGLGVSDFIGRPFSSKLVRRRVSNIIELYKRKGDLEKLVKEQMKKLRQANQFIIDTLGTVVEFRDHGSSGHIRRVRSITEIILEAVVDLYKEYGITSERIQEISFAAALHDIGKIAIPDIILSKQSKLTDAEYEIVKTHTIKGCEILENIDHVHDWEYYQFCYEICRYHHERFDGSGYPDGLKGEMIPFCAQVVSLADTYESLTGIRPYRHPYSHKEVIIMISNGDCGVFNPKLIKCLMAVEDTLEERLNYIKDNSVVESFSVAFTSHDKEAISERTLRLLELEKEKYKTLAELSGESLFSYNDSTDTVILSEKFINVFGNSISGTNAREQLITSMLIDERDKKKLMEIKQKVSVENPSYILELRIRTASGSMEWFELKMHTLWELDIVPKFVGCLGKFTNINRQKIETNRLREQANHDPLTGLYNRGAAKRLVNEILDQQDAHKAALMFIDLDNFKQVNDVYGHPFGDEVLKYVADELRAQFRSMDIIARLGGDEFIVFLNNIYTKRSIIRKANELLNAFRDNDFSNKSDFKISISVGISCFPDDGTIYEELLAKADYALYQSKNNGKGTFSFYDQKDNSDDVEIMSSDIYKDSIELSSQNMKYPSAAFRDALTGVSNFDGFKLEIAETLKNRTGENISIWYCDLKNFKYINDIFGYDAGDKILKYMADSLKNELSGNEAIGRITGDNFTCLFTYENRKELEERFWRIENHLENFDKVAINRFRLEMVVGIYCIESSKDLLSLEDMLDRANIAQKNVKSKNGSQIAFYTEEMRRKVIREKEIEASMSKALLNGEFVVYAQPQISTQLSDKKLRAEALVRWKETDRGLILPSEFIPLFEKNGFIVTLDQFVFKKVCQYLAGLKEDIREHICLSVNVSRAAVFQPNFVEKYSSLKEVYKIPDGCIELEFTESIAVQNHKRFREVILELKEKGFMCALDDFGSGYSSLNILKDLPMDILKIDKVFFEHSQDTERDYAIITSVIQMAKSLKMITVAEGIEESEQVEYLMKNGCEYIQGYYYAKPAPIELLMDIIDSIRKRMI